MAGNVTPNDCSKFLEPNSPADIETQGVPNSDRSDLPCPQKLTIKDESELASNEELALQGNFLTDTKD
jgi:hypothetical protein